MLHCTEVSQQMIALGHEQPIRGVPAMSASHPKATVTITCRNGSLSA